MQPKSDSTYSSSDPNASGEQGSGVHTATPNQREFLVALDVFMGLNTLLSYGIRLLMVDPEWNNGKHLSEIRPDNGLDPARNEEIRENAQRINAEADIARL